MEKITEIKIAYFGGEPLGVPVLEKLIAAGLTPELVVCNPDRPAGRGQVLTPPPVKVLAQQHAIETFQPGSFDEDAQLERLTEEPWDLFVVVAYNHILPSWLIELPKYKTLNVHPSLLPKLRGPSPIRTAIVENKPEEVGVSIMLMDDAMDHGPLLAQSTYSLEDSSWPPLGTVLDAELAHMGGDLLANTIPKWLDGSCTPKEQNHDEATYTKKLTKAQGELMLDPHNLPRGEAAFEMLNKIKGLAGWPGTFFFHEDKRIKIIDATLTTDGTLEPLTVTPEGKSVIDFKVWLSDLNS